jgi:hypothetical protein
MMMDSLAVGLLLVRFSGQQAATAGLLRFSPV